MSNQKKRELYFILVCSIIALIVGWFCGCSHIQEREYYESGQMKKDTEKYGILFSDGKQFSIIEIN